MKRHLFRVLLALLALPTVAFANSGAPPAFDALNNSMMNMATGPLGTMLAMTMLVMGMGIAVAKNSPMPAISAMMGAGFLHWGPAFIMTIMGGAQSYSAYSSEKTVQVFAAKPQPASTALSASTSKARPPVVASQAQTVAVTQAASTPVVMVAQQTKPVAPEVTNLTDTSKGATVVPTPKTKPAAVVAHTVPVPAAVTMHRALKAPAVSTSEVTKWLGLGGAVIILTLLGLLTYLSARRKPKAVSGFISGSATHAPAASAFMDPHGFQREKRMPTFGHESN